MIFSLTRYPLKQKMKDETRRDVRFSDEIAIETLPAVDADFHDDAVSAARSATFHSIPASGATATITSALDAAFGIAKDAAKLEDSASLSTPQTKAAPPPPANVAKESPLPNIPAPTAAKTAETPKSKEDKREIGLKRLKGRFANLSDTINQMGEYVIGRQREKK